MTHLPQATWSKNSYVSQFSINIHILKIDGKFLKIKIILQNLAVEGGSSFVILFKKMGYFFLNIRKKLKKIKNIILKIINISPSTYSLMYVLKKKSHFLEIFFKNIFPNFSQFSEFQWDNGDGDIGGDGENFLIGKCCENEMT